MSLWEVVNIPTVQLHPYEYLYKLRSKAMFKGSSEWPFMWVISNVNPECLNPLGSVLAITVVGGKSLQAFIGFRWSALAWFLVVDGAILLCVPIRASE